MASVLIVQPLSLWWTRTHYPEKLGKCVIQVTIVYLSAAKYMLSTLVTIPEEQL